LRDNARRSPAACAAERIPEISDAGGGADMTKKLVFVGLTMVGTLFSSCVGNALLWAFAGFF